MKYLSNPNPPTQSMENRITNRTDISSSLVRQSLTGLTKAKETLSVVPQLNDLSAALWYEMRLKGISFHCAPTWLWRRTTTSRRDRGCKNVTTFYEERAGEMVVAANNNKFRRQSTRTEQHNNMTINTLSVDRNVTSRATLTCRTTTTINTIEAKA